MYVRKSLAVTTPPSQAKRKAWPGLPIKLRFSICRDKPSLGPERPNVFRIPLSTISALSLRVLAALASKVLVDLKSRTLDAWPAPENEHSGALGNVMAQNVGVGRGLSIDTGNCCCTTENLFYNRVKVRDIYVKDLSY